MRLILVLVGMLISNVAFAQPERYELGRKVHALEEAWEKNPPSAEAKKRATPLINQAVQSFFRFNMSAAAKYIDEARHALLSPDTVASGVKWADAISLQPETRLVDAKTPEWIITAKQFYKPDATAPENLVARFTVGDTKVIELPLAKLPATLTVPLKMIPGPKNGDVIVRIEIDGDDKVLAVKSLTLSRIEELEKRLDAIRSAAEAKPAKPSIEHSTLVHISKLLSDLAAKGTPETDYPALKLITEAEQIITAKKDYFDSQLGGEHWLGLTTSKGGTVVRVRLPIAMSKEKPLPVVVALHGMGGSENMYFDAYGNGIVPRLAQARGWIVIGTRVGGFLGTGAAPDVSGILDELAKRYPIDRKRIFLVGHSMGAGHAMLLSQQLPQQFAGVAALGGGGRVGKPENVKDLPFFIGCGKQDFALRGAKLMYDSLTAVKTPVTFKEYEDIEHLAIVQEAAKDVFDFFDKLAKSPK